MFLAHPSCLKEANNNCPMVRTHEQYLSDDRCLSLSDNIGFSDTVEYEAVALRDGLVVLSW
jgi:hypothetical protein